MLFLLWACARTPEPAPIQAPETHSWQEEGELVVTGLRESKRLWIEQQSEAARTLAERVYTERWEPKLEGAAREIYGSERSTEIEYHFGQLLTDLKPNTSKDKLEARFKRIEEDVRKVASDASYRYPPIGEAPQAPPDGSNTSRPLVPDVPPNWERDAPTEDDQGQ